MKENKKKLKNLIGIGTKNAENAENSDANSITEYNTTDINSVLDSDLL